MTTTRRPATCTNCGLKLTASNTAHAHGDMGVHDTCHWCWESFGLENDHNDHGHDEPREGCPECGLYVPPTQRESRKGHTNTQKHSNSSHKGCDHLSTPAARAKCRKARAIKAMTTKDLIAQYEVDKVPGSYTITAREAMRRKIAPLVDELLRRANDLADEAAQAFFDN